LTSAATLPLSTARSSLETSLSRSCSTATTKRLLFPLTAFAKSQRGNHECRSCDLPRGGTAHYYSSGCSSCFIIYSTAPPRPPRKRPNKWPITARGASDHNPYQGVLQTMALHAAHDMSYRS